MLQSLSAMVHTFVAQAPGFGTIVWWVAVVVGVIFIVAGIFFILAFGKLWIQAYSSGCPIPIKQFVGMFLRRVSPQLITDTLVISTKAGVPVDIDKLEAHVLARGNVRQVVQALVAASRANIELSFERAAAIDLAGRDVLEAVRTSVHPKVIDCPHAGRGRNTMDAVAKDGIQLKTRARVTVRTNLATLVGGATEDTVIARVGEGIVAAIGSASSHKEVLANPRRISQEVLEAGLDAQTAYEIVSIDIADVDVGENIGARLLVDKAEAEKKRAQAEAEAKRAQAVARAQEMEALNIENRAKVILAEAEIPRSIAGAFDKGNLGLMDYYNFRNVQADTKMRDNLAHSMEANDDELSPGGAR